MSDTPAVDIRSAREARGWDQAELARMLGVGQQTVSRWERGQTSPRGELLDRLRATLGLDGAVTPPRRPLLDELPFNRLDAYQFEAFCDAFLSRLYSDAQEVARYGVSGDTQHGIDIRVVTADGERIGIQCKKYEKFRPASFAKAVAELDRARARVDRCVLFLSTRASAAVLEACDKLDEWTIWDSRTLSREVDKLPRHQALTLVDRFFPDMREEFLGVRAPSIWQTAEEAFPASLPSPVYSHGFRLVGRTATLDEMTAFAAGDDEPRIAVLTGAAGQGKSRLLCELARTWERTPGATTWVLPPGPCALDEFDHLPRDGRLLVLIEDAHERSDDLAMVVTGILRARPHARTVIATRPYGRLVVQQALRAAKTDENQVSRWDLSSLRHEDAYALASEILGGGNEHAARVVAHVAADSPLLLVNAAIAVQRGDLEVSALQSHADVHRLLIDVFAQSALSQSPQPDDDRALLHAVAALQPVATDVPHFQNALSSILELPFTRINPRLRTLEGTGILVRRGASVRISPDLLGDVLLAEAAVHPHSGSPTGYLQLVRDRADGDALANALVNAGRVDWQAHSRSSLHKGVVDPLWAAMEAEFKEGGADTRMALLPLLRKIAPFQPERVFRLTRWALDHPATGDELPSQDRWMSEACGQAGILRETPRVLEAVAVDLDHLRSVYDLLWSLGRNDERPLNQNPDAPLRILLDLASYGPGKPVQYQEILLDALSEWLEETVPGPTNRMPLALLDPLFSDTAEGRTREGWTLTFHRYPVRAEVVEPIRDRAAGILLDQYVSGNEGRAVAAARTFREVLRHQTEDFAQYNAEFLRVLGARTAALRPGPLVSLAVRRSLSWVLRHGPTSISEAAQTVVDSLPDEAGHRLALLLHTGTYDETLVPRTADTESLESVQGYWATLRRATLAELMRQPTDQVASLFVSLVEKGHRVLAHHSEGVRTVLDEALSESPDLVPALLDRLAHAEEGAVQVMLPTVLHASFGLDVPRAVETCRRLVADGSAAEVLAATQALQNVIHETSVQEAGALDLARALADHPAPTVRAGVLAMAVSLLRTSRELALELLTSVPFGDTGAVPYRLWWAFTMERLLSWQDLTSAQRVFFIDQLAALPTLSDHTVQQFIAHLVQADAEAAVGLLRSRIERWEEAPTDERFDPLPFEWSVALPFSDSAARPDLLRSVQGWLAQPRDNSWRREFHAPQLFWTVAGPADEVVLSLLLEPYQEGNIDLAHAAAPLLSRLPENVVWDRVDFVSTLLKTASRLSEDLLHRTGGRLYSALFSGVRWRELGKPYQEDVDISDRARHIRAGLPRGSAVDLFYKALQESAQHNIDRAIAEDLDEL
ncbi:helix-turn-helix domain-containing protein [Streptomyces antimicrobicus]|uniref:helix-turn-helix domain-containing protein n=1 Tax=Streptomyces antimicrobicus TaxID=2883108 RepID=UPI0021F682C1|nr:helix-turn-helix domain-containing protein [Streptomyces antimicrobicus]